MPPWSSMEEDGVELVDLTGDSPSPPPRAQMRRPPQQPTSAYVKRESRKPSPAVNPNTLRHIIATSDPVGLQNVLLDLCKLSPALSGALARGLLPHSTHAQQLVNRSAVNRSAVNRSAVNRSAVNRAEAPRIKADPGARWKAIQDMSNRGKIKQEPKKSSTSASYQATPITKRETESVSLSDSSDDEILRQDPFESRSASKAWGSSAAGPSRPRGTSKFLRSPSTETEAESEHLSSPTFARSLAPQTKCKNCNQPFKEGAFSVCSYHPGRRAMITDDNGDRVDVYTCCNATMGTIGCESGAHEGTKEEGNYRKSSPAKRLRLS
ncbi:hypothetical protein P280DRAFT_145054 [Massarina eburnea CBS 473.64]|uniref:Uncharacterized protein n=1 Tax=Massarina eburnea CBS 473.64 TaxID=1395130 RepID=A0A6A6RP71_9PLEO|nr:hypothetical protein P280DRAFT_145054 [Massarina eburnea CBS 473.64]